MVTLRCEASQRITLSDALSVRLGFKSTNIMFFVDLIPHLLDILKLNACFDYQKQP